MTQKVNRWYPYTNPSGWCRPQGAAGDGVETSQVNELKPIVSSCPHAHQEPVLWI